jgi:uncharacterized protein YaeQ
MSAAIGRAEGAPFSRGVSDPDDPAIAVRDLTGAITTWFDVGTPDAARLLSERETAAGRGASLTQT